MTAVVYDVLQWLPLCGRHDVLLLLLLLLLLGLTLFRRQVNHLPRQRGRMMVERETVDMQLAGTIA